MIPYLITAFGFFWVIGAVDPVVDLSYSKYEGTSLPNGVSQWLGIRYAVRVPSNLYESKSDYVNRLLLWGPFVLQLPPHQYTIQPFKKLTK